MSQRLDAMDELQTQLGLKMQKMDDQTLKLLSILEDSNLSESIGKMRQSGSLTNGKERDTPLAKLQRDFQLLVGELHRDKLDIIKELDELGVSKHFVKRKVDALGWHGRCQSILQLSQVQEALLLFKKQLVPSDKIVIRNQYTKLKDHRSEAVVYMSNLLKNEAFSEKILLKSMTSSQTLS